MKRRGLTRMAAMSLELITISFLLTFTFSSFDTNLFVVLLESGKIFTSLGELSFFHTLTNIPVNGCTLGVHKVKLVVNAGEDLGDGGRVGDHADGAHDLGQVTTRNNGGGLVVDTALETSGR